MKITALDFAMRVYFTSHAKRRTPEDVSSRRGLGPQRHPDE
jgi:hypothetical protein